MIAIRTVLGKSLTAGLAAVFLFAGGCEQMGQQEGTEMPGTNGAAREAEPGADTAAQDTAREDTAQMDTGNGMGNGDTADTANGGNALFGGNGGTRTTATVSSVSPQDSTIVITDTIRVQRETSIQMNGKTMSLDQLQEGEEVDIQYQMQNGEKVATEISEAQKPEQKQQDQQQEQQQRSPR
ncbi:MAG: hypothetical protein GF331_25355 [Chitinivibrionales bacterium]|nr:hypothetical protein [Chitinivibrionales bacterium]